MATALILRACEFCIGTLFFPPLDYAYIRLDFILAFSHWFCYIVAFGSILNNENCPPSSPLCSTFLFSD